MASGLRRRRGAHGDPARSGDADRALRARPVVDRHLDDVGASSVRRGDPAVAPLPQHPVACRRPPHPGAAPGTRPADPRHRPSALLADTRRGDAGLRLTAPGRAREYRQWASMCPRPSRGWSWRPEAVGRLRDRRVDDGQRSIDERRIRRSPRGSPRGTHRSDRTSLSARAVTAPTRGDTGPIGLSLQSWMGEMWHLGRRSGQRAPRVRSPEGLTQWYRTDTMPAWP